MPEISAAMDWAEAALLATGSILLLTWLVQNTRRRRWPEVLHFPPPRPNDISPVDLWLALALYLLAPTVITRSIGLFYPEAIPASQPDEPARLTTPQITAMTASLLCIAAGLLLIGRRPFRSFAAWGLTFHDLPRRLGQAALIYMMIWPICALLLMLSSAVLPLIFPEIELREHDTIANLLSAEGGAIAKTLLVINAMLLAPSTEELFFRGIAVTFLRSISSAWPAIILSGVAFGFFHYPLWHFILPLSFLGIVLGYVYARTQSLTLVICVHLVFNTKTLLWIALGMVF